jgi:hypothetical protein
MFFHPCNHHHPNLLIVVALTIPITFVFWSSFYHGGGFLTVRMSLSSPLSCDPFIFLMSLSWFSCCYNVPTNAFVLWSSIHPHNCHHIGLFVAATFSPSHSYYDFLLIFIVIIVFIFLFLQSLHHHFCFVIHFSSS